MPTIFFKKVENAETIASTAIWQPKDTQITEDDIGRHGPFNHLTVYNNSANDVEVRLYGNDTRGVEYLPAGAALVFDKDDDIQYYRPSIYNRDAGTIAANQIILMVRKVAKSNSPA